MTNFKAPMTADEKTEKRTTKKQFARRNERENQKERVESRRISASCRKPPGVEKENSLSQKKGREHSEKSTS